MELKGEMNLQVADPSNAHIKLALTPFPTDFGLDLQFKQHPNVAKFSPNQEKIIALKDPSRAFPVGQALAVLKWRYTGQDESYVPLSSKTLFLSRPSRLADTFPLFFFYLPPAYSQLLAVPIQRRQVRRQH